MYSLSTFLKPITTSDTTVQIRTQDLVVKYTISPYTVKSVIVSNNLLKVSLNSNREIVLDFSTKLEAIQSGALIESAFETLRGKPPLFIDKIVKEYVTDIATSQGDPTDPTTTTSMIGVMMGLSQSITPVRSGKILIIISGDIDSDMSGAGSQVQIRFGTGTAPINNDSLTGTPIGGLVKFIQNNDVQRHPWGLNAIVSELTLNTPVWVDISLAAITGGNARVRDISVSIVEL